jgi:hypothetical protein
VLRNPNITTNYIADSKLCKDCQPKRKPPRKLTAKEIRTRITNKDIHYITGETLLKKKREEEDLLFEQAKKCREWERNQWWVDRARCRSMMEYKQALNDGMKEGGNDDEERMRWWFERHYIRARFWPHWRPIFGRWPNDNLYWEEFEEERCSNIELHDMMQRDRDARSNNNERMLEEEEVEEVEGGGEDNTVVEGGELNEVSDDDDSTEA